MRRPQLVRGFPVEAEANAPHMFCKFIANARRTPEQIDRAHTPRRRCPYSFEALVTRKVRSSNSADTDDLSTSGVLKKMLRKLAMLATLSVMSLGSASAATLYMPAASGVLDQIQAHTLAGGENGCLTDIAYGRMVVQPYPLLPNNDCFMAFPINLPVGTTIDGVEVSYREDAPNASGRSIVATLLSNGVKPYTGQHLLGAASDYFVSPSNQQLFANMGSLSVAVTNGTVYWVQVSSHRVTEIDSVAVTYH